MKFIKRFLPGSLAMAAGSFLFVVFVALILGATARHALSIDVNPDFSAPRQASYLLSVNGEGRCSAVLIKEDTLLTAGHCIAEDENTKYSIDGKSATVLKVNKDRDLALLKADVDGKEIPLAPKDVPLDYPLVIVGFPASSLSGETEYLTEGRRMANHKDRPQFMNMTVPVIYGNSGGGVFAFIDGQWYVVGIEVGIYILGDGFFMPQVVVTHMSIAAHLQSIKEFLK